MSGGGPLRDDLGDGAERARLFGDRSGWFTVAEAANFAGITYATAYHWHRSELFSPEGPIGERFESPAQRAYSPRDVLILAVIREANSRCNVSGHRHRRARFLRRIARAVRDAEEVLTSFSRQLRVFLLATDQEAIVVRGGHSLTEAIDRLEHHCPKTLVLLDVAEIHAQLPAAAHSHEVQR